MLIGRRTTIRCCPTRRYLLERPAVLMGNVDEEVAVIAEGLWLHFPDVEEGED